MGQEKKRMGVHASGRTGCDIIAFDVGHSEGAEDKTEDCKRPIDEEGAGHKGLYKLNGWTLERF